MPACAKTGHSGRLASDRSIDGARASLLTVSGSCESIARGGHEVDAGGGAQLLVGRDDRRSDRARDVERHGARHSLDPQGHRCRLQKLVPVFEQLASTLKDIKVDRLVVMGGLDADRAERVPLNTRCAI